MPKTLKGREGFGHSWTNNKVSCCFVGVVFLSCSKSSPFHTHPLNQGSEEEEEDSSFSAEVEDNSKDSESLSLGSQDTHLSNNKVQDLHNDTAAAANMPTPKKPVSSKKAKKRSVAGVTEGLSAMTVKSAPRQVTYYSLNWSFPYQIYSVVEGSKEIIYADFLCANLPKSYVKMAKVLRGGFQLAFLMAVPKWFYDEFYSKKQMGQEYDERHARVQARSRQVIQPVRREFQSLDEFHLGEPQVLNLPFQCIEGDYAPRWGSWSTKGMERVDGHKQYQKCVTIRIISVSDWLARVDEQEDVIYGHANDNDDSDDSNGGRMDDDDYID